MISARGKGKPSPQGLAQASGARLAFTGRGEMGRMVQFDKHLRGILRAGQ